MIPGIMKNAWRITAVLLLSMCWSGLGAAGLKKFHAAPDQVLVLYNLDWETDVDGSAPGQDSEEVAQYYVKMHTDPNTGQKPHLLGLSCRHKKKHLNEWVIREKSQDNKDGMEYIGKGRGPNGEEWARDSRKVEIVIKPQKNDIDWDTVAFWCKSATGDKKKVIDPVVTGAPEQKGRQTVYPKVESGKGRCYRFDAHKYSKGTFQVLAEVRDRTGKMVKTLNLKYYDRDDFRFSTSGTDGISDELHFQEDVAMPVKAFLEDPANVLADGALLKDHILYIVICHGLPYSCEGVFGIERGVTSRPNDHGDLGSLEQRLQTLYYGWGRQIRPPVISMYMSDGPGAKDGVRNHRITSAMRYPMVGKRWHPYMHPDTYSFLGSKKDPKFIQISPFPVVRKMVPAPLFAYGVSRIDGQGPREAKRLVDYALYASRFLRPEMDAQVRKGLYQKGKREIADLDQRLALAEKDNQWGKQRARGAGVCSSVQTQPGGDSFSQASD